MKILLETIPHYQQVYPTVGDWRVANAIVQQVDLQPAKPAEGELPPIEKVLLIRSSQLPDPRMELLVQIHELVEATLCEHAGVTQEQVDVFDKKFEADRALGLHGETDESGDAHDAPYRMQHGIATSVERLMAALLGVDWNEYDAAINALP